jgi:hypothetical protein
MNPLRHSTKISSVSKTGTNPTTFLIFNISESKSFSKRTDSKDRTLDHCSETNARLAVPFFPRRQPALNLIHTLK